jgi:hypothetical protein
MKFRSLTIFYRSICRISLSLVVGLAASVASAKTDSFWDFVDRVVTSHPETRSAKAAAEYQSAIYESMGWWDDPSLEVLQSNRDAQGQESTVLGFALRQRLPFWGPRQRHRPAQQAKAEAAKLQSEAQRRLIENDTVQKIYLYARAKVEQRHLEERRARLSLLKSALLRTKAASPGQNIERQLVASAIVLTESQFDTIDSEVATRRAELKQMGLDDKSVISVNWVSPSEFKKFVLDKESSAIRANPIVEGKRKMSQAASLEREALKARPEFEIFAQSDDERGGARERNFAVGIGLRLPVNALFGVQKRAGDADVLKFDAELQSVERSQSVRLAALTLELSLAEKSLRRFSPDKVRELEAVVEAGEADARRGWVTVAQLLELERQIHSQIEATYDVQMRTVELMKQSCDVYECDVRKYLGGVL